MRTLEIPMYFNRYFLSYRVFLANQYIINQLFNDFPV